MMTPRTRFLCLMLVAAGCRAGSEDEADADDYDEWEPPVLTGGAPSLGGGGTQQTTGSAGKAGSTPTPSLGGGGSSPSVGGGTAGRGGSGGSGGGKATGGSSSGGSGGKATGGSSSGAGGAAGSGASAGGSPSGGAGAPTTGGGSCLNGITNFKSAGPFTSKSQRSGSINFYVPSVPAGCKVPVVHLANGTGASCATYLATLTRLATHGFLAACYESTNTGAGDQTVKAFETAISMFPELVDKRLGTTGHSQGGQGAFTGLALAEKKFGAEYVYAGLAMQPASGFGSQPAGASWQSLYGGIKSPMFMFSGLGSDGLVSQSWVQSAYNATAKTQEAYFWTYNGSRHIPVPNTETQEVAIPWFRWKLLGDQAACRAFVDLPKTNTKWAQASAKNQVPCQ